MTPKQQKLYEAYMAEVATAQSKLMELVIEDAMWLTAGHCDQSEIEDLAWVSTQERQIASEIDLVHLDEMIDDYQNHINNHMMEKLSENVN